MKRDARWSVSSASLHCRSAIPSTHRASSRDLGWKALLVDVHSGIRWDKAYTAVTTLDPRIGVSLSGQYVCHYHHKGVWRPDVFRPGTTTVLRSDEPRRFRFTPLEMRECQFALLYIPLHQLEEMAEQLRRPGQQLSVPWFHQLLAHDAAITQVTRALIAAMEAGADELYAETVSAWLVAHVLVQYGPAALREESRGEGEISDRRLRRALELISAHFAERLTLAQLAAEAGISKFHFTRLFRKKVGMTPYRLLTETRLAAGRRMLLATDLTVGEVALHCGYASASHFTTAFTARYGTSPQDTRRT